MIILKAIKPYKLLILIVVLMTIIIVKYFYFSSHRNCVYSIPIETQNKIDITTLIDALRDYYHDKRCLPKDENEFNREIVFSEPRYLFFQKQGICYFDIWGNLFRYKYLGKDEKGEETFIVYSCGSNGKDENGKGDDITKTFSISPEDEYLKSPKENQVKEQDKPFDLKLIPWSEILKYKNGGELYDFMVKYKLFDNGIYERELCAYILSRCDEYEKDNDTFWAIFNKIGDELTDAHMGEMYADVCWEKCARYPLFFYERYCKGDRSALNRYYDAYPFEGEGDDWLFMLRHIRDLIKEANHLQKDPIQRNKDVALIEKWIKELEQDH